MRNVVDDARKLKSEAMELRDQGDLSGAIRTLERAEQDLRLALNELRSNRTGTERPGRFEVDIANQLLHILGSKGGTWRRAKNYEAAASAYDAGYEFEKPESIYGIVNSYNLVQRLVSRVFIKPESVLDPNIEVSGLLVRPALLEAKEQIQEQLRGKRIGDEYAAADLAVVLLLLADQEWELALDDFIYANPAPQPYCIKVTRELIEELRGALEAPDTPKALRDRLSQADRELAAV